MQSMMKKIRAVVASVSLALVAGIAGPALAADALVDVAWVKENTGKDGIVFVDVRGQADYLRGHIPGAVNTDYGKAGWRVAINKVPGYFPEDPSDLAAHIGSLGIGNDTHVVLVAPGTSSSDMGTATRMYWTFKVLGHDEVSILNGGMAAYLSEVDGDKNPVNPLEKGVVEADAKTFNVALREDMLIGAEDVQSLSDSGSVLVDHRPADQYLGVNKAGPAKMAGTIPGAVNLPNTWMTDNAGGMFRDSETLAKLYDAAGVPTSGDQVNFCNTGHWASVGWFVSSEILGNKQAVMYDGSMVDWTSKDMPMEASVSVN
jgi:thiosulfate/3-mercaptopyruvate sulfurtransferase